MPGDLSPQVSCILPRPNARKLSREPSLGTDDKTAPESRKTSKGWHGNSRQRVDDTIADNIDPNKISYLEHSEVELGLAHMASGRRFYLTQSGLVGWVPREAQCADIVSFLCGSKVPIILRPEGDVYLVIGQSCIHGIVDGEALFGSTVQFKPMGMAETMSMTPSMSFLRYVTSDQQVSNRHIDIAYS